MRTRSFVLVAGLLVGPAVAGAALAGRTQVDEFQWVDGGQALALHGDGAHLVVTQATPAPLHGLQAGDVLVAVEGHPVHGTDALMQTFRNAHGRTVQVEVARNGQARTLRWSAADYHVFLPPPPPPAPPSPPPPPPPPSPPPSPGN